MANSAEDRQIDESSLRPSPTAFKPPLVRHDTPGDRIGFTTKVGNSFNATIDAVVHAPGNSPVGFSMVIGSAIGSAIADVALCWWWHAPGWIALITAALAFVGVTLLGTRFIANASGATAVRASRRGRGRGRGRTRSSK